MDFRRFRWVIGAVAGAFLSGAPALASAQDLCAPSEATDPQPLHINGAKTFVYKTVGGADLRLYVFNSAAHKPSVRAPAVVFFFGGGFFFGDIRRYQTQATHLALRGLVTVLADYRVKCRHGSTIMDSVSDGKSAMRWVRGHADEFGIDPTRIAAVGSSSGALMAAADALVSDFDDPGDMKTDARPNALILYNPALAMTSPTVIRNLTNNWGKAVADRAPDFSPIDHLSRALPPTIIFQGTADKGVSPATVKDFCARARALKAPQCEVVLYPGAPHGFSEIWLGLDDPANFPKTEYWAADTSRRTDAFLTKLGWLPRR
ncbi:MAG TPA: alpha/beta hydrolase [Caulobacteraceae bacterium]|nr:alpha/beta hydrolase [Caulobacteraceae bacterium]